MIRAIIGIVVVTALVAAAVFFADHPGRVEILWQGWQIQTSVAVLAAAAILAALVAGLLFSVLSLVVDSPRRLMRARREWRRRTGYRALAQGMVAVAAGDPQEARRYAKRADLLLADPPLTLLLSAQAAQPEKLGFRSLEHCCEELLCRSLVAVELRRLSGKEQGQRRIGE